MDFNTKNRNIRDEKFMRLALDMASLASSLGEVPVGAIIVLDDEVVGAGYNLRETNKNSLAHAEIISINNACKALDKWRLENCELYVTLEPCPMCAGAIINSRIKRVVFGAKDMKTGCFGSVANFSAYNLGHSVQIKSQVLADECENLLKVFFESLR